MIFSTRFNQPFCVSGKIFIKIQLDLNGDFLNELDEINSFIDDNIDDHISLFQECVRQKSISQTGEGIMGMAKLLASLYRELGCKEVRIDGPWGEEVGEGGSKGNPVVYGEYDEGKDKTIIVYFMYDTMPIFSPEKWSVPPFQGRLVGTEDPFPEVLMGRGATNTKGPMAAFLAACRSIQAVTGELPINMKFIAEGDEERLSMGLIKFVNENKEALERADALFFPMRSQDRNGLATPLSGSEGLLYLDLETSGEYWGRGPMKYNLHGARKLILDSPAWRHIEMLGTLTSDNGNSILIDGWYNNLLTEPTGGDETLIEKMIEKGVIDVDQMKEDMGVEHFIDDTEDPRALLVMQLYGTSFNLDGIYGGNMTPYAGAVLPMNIVSKHNIRFNPNQRPDDLIEKIRLHLDDNGFKDVRIRVIGHMDWCLNNWDHDLARALFKTFDEFNTDYVLKPPTGLTGETAPAWPAYLFGKDPLKLPIIGGGLGHGGRAHTVDEYYVIEGTEKVRGYADTIKGFVTTLYNYTNLHNIIKE
jgi:acetylornithine deacetylase/succinyl-diaminopimelate desuccinylase-like protein